jgi:PPM family protein phosphatase
MSQSESVKFDPAALRLETFGISDIGLIRQNNEDVWLELPEYRFYLLADGMGGHQAGEVAAREVASFLSDYVKNLFATKNDSFTIDALALKLKEGIKRANRWVYELSHKHEELSGMGTTLCCFLLYEGVLIYAHVGDSRIYRFRNTLEQLTQDHSLRRELMHRLHLEERKANTMAFKNIITRAIGTSLNVEPDIATLRVQPQDIYFLCSDGLTDTVSDKEIMHLVQKGASVKQTCENLVSLAKTKGGIDNITIVMIKIH